MTRADGVHVGDRIRTPAERAHGITRPAEQWREVIELETTTAGFIRLKFRQLDRVTGRYHERWTIVPPWKEFERQEGNQ